MTRDRSEGSSPVPHIKDGDPATAAGRYLYAIVPGTEVKVLGAVGVGAAGVYSVPEGRISAVVSDFSGSKIRPERRHLAAHQGVLKALLQQDVTPLPVAFGVVADGNKGLKKILSKNQGLFLENLERVEGKVEMGVRVVWDVPNIFEYFVTVHDDLRDARNRLFGGHREPSQDEKIEVGRTFERLLVEDRESHSEQVEKALAGIASEIKRNRVRSEREVMNLACLVRRDNLKDFEAAVFDSARLFDNSFAFDYNGPWAPHSFVEIELSI